MISLYKIRDLKLALKILMTGRK